MNDNPNKTVTMNQTSSNQNAAIEQKKAEIPAPAVHAAEQMARLNLPAAITLNNDKIELKLDSLKFWNINRIDTIDNEKKQNFGIETPSSHYGLVYREQGSPFFIGSGHCESGKSEQLAALTMASTSSLVMSAVIILIISFSNFLIPLKDNTDLI